MHTMQVHGAMWPGSAGFRNEPVTLPPVVAFFAFLRCGKNILSEFRTLCINHKRSQMAAIILIPWCTIRRQL